MYIARGEIAPFTVGSVVRALDIFRTVSQWHWVVGRWRAMLCRKGWPLLKSRAGKRKTQTVSLPRRGYGEFRNTRATNGKQRNFWVRKDRRLVSILLMMV